MRTYKLLLAYQHDYNCVSESLLQRFLGQSEAQRRLERFEAVQRQAEGWYR